ncbi:MAG TPA: glycoside hydrolase family 44 protein [Candidatus Sulfopaludibacter sp.]|nr:glycoside hydrolase family 44 protein [Candidatus Sulfopaludibacter sp.]
MKRLPLSQWLCGLMVWQLWFQVASRADQIVYDDKLENGWQNWSWATVNLANTSPVHSGSDSISVTASNTPTNWQALYLEISAMNSSGFTNLTFWINGGSAGGQQVQGQGLLNGSAQSAVQIGPLTANSWRQVNVSLSALGVANQPNFTGLWLQAEGGSLVPTFYVDDITLQSGPTSQSGTNAPVAIGADALANRHPISPLIYGVAFATSNQLSDLNSTMNRSGGNNETRDNWQINAHNLDADWYFESYPDSSSTVPGNTIDAFVANSKNGGAQPLITISMIGWMPQLGSGRGILYSYATNKYGPQTSTDPYLSAAGNGVGTNTSSQVGWLITTNGPISPVNGQFVTSGLNTGFGTTNNPNDANFPTNAVFEQGLVQHLMNQWGPSTNGGVGYYIMDNEESIWFSTHRDVHPVGPTMQEIFNDFITYASMTKSNDPDALVCGFEEWGWNGYLYSGYDQQNPGYTDRAANGGWDYMPWLLNQVHQHDLGTGQRLLDYFTLHCYPQEGDVSSSSDISTATDLLRNQSTRVFWDSNYVDPSWINSVIMLIPRMKSWVATNYPGTKIGVTEYNWGAETNINGATAQADILGIFGWQGLDLATRWTVPASGSPTYNAMKLYRNYDGKRSTFGDTSIQTTVPNPDDLSAFGAVRTSDGALTLMVINKDLNNASPIVASITNFPASGTAQRWQLTSANVINQLANLTLTNDVLSDLLPAQSITLFVLPATNRFSLQIGGGSPPGQLGIWLNGEAGQSYTLQSSADLVHWSAVSSDLLTSNSFEFFVATTNAAQMFYRGQSTNL